MIKIIRLGCIGAFTLLGVSAAVHAQTSQRWINPTYNSDQIQEIQRDMIRVYNYEETPILNTEFSAPDESYQYDFTSPEKAFVSRFMAMKNLDYEVWIETWEEASWDIASERYTDEGLTERYWINGWRAQIVPSIIIPIRKIEFLEYVIFTYQLYTPDRIAISPFEVPVVLKNIDNQWKVTLDLQASSLLSYSPWLSGQMTQTEEVLDIPF